MLLLTSWALASLMLGGAPPGLRHHPGATDPEAPQAISLFLDRGLRQPAETASESAQAYYDQGISLLAGYRFALARRSFEHAIALDGTMPMARVGLARALWNLEDFPAAWHELETARHQVSSAPDRIKVRVELAVRQLRALTTSGQAHHEALLQLRQGIEKALRDDISDPHLLTLRGNASESNSWLRGQSGSVEAVAWYSAALNTDPDHLGAHHFLAHAYENLNRYDLALEHAKSFERLAPAMPHAPHMVGHVLISLGRFRAAKKALETAHDLHLRQADDFGIRLTEDWHYGHNLRLLAALSFAAGDRAAAESYFEQIYQLRGPGYRGGRSCLPLIEYLLLQQDAREALARARQCSAEEDPFSSFFATVLAGEAHLAIGELGPARASLREARQHLAEANSELGSHPLATARARRMLLLTNILAVKLDLMSRDPDGASDLDEAATIDLLQLADRLTRARGADGWAHGVVRILELESFAAGQGLPELATKIRDRSKRLDRTSISAEHL